MPCLVATRMPEHICLRHQATYSSLVCSKYYALLQQSPRLAYPTVSKHLSGVRAACECRHPERRA